MLTDALRSPLDSTFSCSQTNHTITAAPTDERGGEGGAGDLSRTLTISPGGLDLLYLLTIRGSIVSLSRHFDSIPEGPTILKESLTSRKESPPLSLQ